MSEVGRFTLSLVQGEGYDFAVKFDWKNVPELIMDEPPPLGGQAGPNASRMLAAAVGHCLSASLMYCLAKEEVPPESVTAEVTCRVVRNDKGRMRIGDLAVTLTLADALARSKRISRCLDLFEDFCTVSGSVRQGIPLSVKVVDGDGQVLKESADQPAG